MKVGDISTEERIKEAAKKVFLEKGFDGTKTRDIAQEAGINTALLNYYFRSKEKLFEAIFYEATNNFYEAIFQVINDKMLTFEGKLYKMIERDIDNLLANPLLPIFIHTESSRNPEGFTKKHDLASFFTSDFVAQLNEKIAKGEFRPIHPFHLMTSVVGMVLMPFLNKKLMTSASFFTEDVWTNMVQEKKKLIPEIMLTYLRSK